MTRLTLKVPLMALAVTVAACGAPLPLSEYRDGEVFATLIVHDWSAYTTTLHLSLHRREGSFGFDCPGLAEGVTATANGQPMRVWPGGLGPSSCSTPSFELDLGQLPGEVVDDMSFVAQDSSHRIDLTLTGMLARHRLRPLQDLAVDRPPGENVVQRGQQLAFDLEPSGPLADPFAYLSIEHPPAGGHGYQYTEVDLHPVVDGSRLQLGLPEEIPAGSSYLLSVGVTRKLVASVCEGIASYRAEQALWPTFHVSWAP